MNPIEIIDILHILKSSLTFFHAVWTKWQSVTKTIFRTINIVHKCNTCLLPLQNVWKFRQLPLTILYWAQCFLPAYKIYLRHTSKHDKVFLHVKYKFEFRARFLLIIKPSHISLTQHRLSPSIVSFCTLFAIHPPCNV